MTNNIINTKFIISYIKAIFISAALTILLCGLLSDLGLLIAITASLMLRDWMFRD